MHRSPPVKIPLRKDYNGGASIHAALWRQQIRLIPIAGYQVQYCGQVISAEATLQPTSAVCIDRRGRRFSLDHALCEHSRAARNSSHTMFDKACGVHFARDAKDKTVVDGGWPNQFKKASPGISEVVRYGASGRESACTAQRHAAECPDENMPTPHQPSR